MHVCMSCYEKYEGRFLDIANRYGETFCPKYECHGNVIELDELIAPVIIMLNQKGYLTKFCCSGHWYELVSTPYIYFHEGFIPGTVPESFKIDDHNSDTIRATYEENDQESKYDWVIRVNKELYEWVEGLPELEWL
ncbi:hypothetical protein [Metabacillus arenae]|uniref:Uncharacterized protein n=1 Tax=Metabacillus arenae TaxID=2771434 RepID=A0A926RVM9_9BACI|nr:hypothetical protein [Metabacillus arenae]MBD1379051.1 hypothetical protein [Metabacillus arenae]